MGFSGEFEEKKGEDTDLPKYPYVAMRIPQGKAITRRDEKGGKCERKEGIRKGEVCFVPCHAESTKAHLQYLINDKKYVVVGYGNFDPNSEDARTKKAHRAILEYVELGMPEGSRELDAKLCDKKAKPKKAKDKE